MKLEFHAAVDEMNFRFAFAEVFVPVKRSIVYIRYDAIRDREGTWLQADIVVATEETRQVCLLTVEAVSTLEADNAGVPARLIFLGLIAGSYVKADGSEAVAIDKGRYAARVLRRHAGRNRQVVGMNGKSRRRDVRFACSRHSQGRIILQLVVSKRSSVKGNAPVVVSDVVGLPCAACAGCCAVSDGKVIPNSLHIVIKASDIYSSPFAIRRRKMEVSLVIRHDAAAVSAAVHLAVSVYAVNIVEGHVQRRLVHRNLAGI